MMINLDAPILNIDGTPFRADGAGGQAAGATLRDVVSGTLLTPLPGDEDLTGIAKFGLYELALRTHGGGEVDLKAEDIALIKQRIGRGCHQLIVGRAWGLLEGQP